MTINEDTYKNELKWVEVKWTWAIEAEPRGSTSNLSNTSSIPSPNSFSSTSLTVWKEVAGAWSQSVTSLFTHAAGAKSGFPTICAIWLQRNTIKSRRETKCRTSNKSKTKIACKIKPSPTEPKGKEKPWGRNHQGQST